MTIVARKEAMTNTKITPKFHIGDKVYAIALPNAVPTPRPAVHGLEITEIKRIEPSSMAPYYRVVASKVEGAAGYGFVEGAERFFEFE